ncbi:hypothetical protein ACO2RV_22195 [Ancylobacter sp. VNQ12]|uniref:hypothetical protein n=1 Tax=Ancylobacter sp. VNQ12 TaxID=3400920 RepID=UPI003C034967
MSLMSEIQALRTEIRAHTSKPSTTAENAGAEPARSEPSAGPPGQANDVDIVLKAVNDTLDEFADELDRFPRLTALAALGVGLAAGVVIGRQLR